LVSLLYVAVIEWLPIESVEIVHVAWPPLRATLLQFMFAPPSLNVTEPLGGVGPAPDTFAVNVTDWPASDGLMFDVRVVVEVALSIVSVPVAGLSTLTVKFVVAVVLNVVTVSVKLLTVQGGVLALLHVTLPLGLNVPVTPDGRPETLGVVVWLPLPLLLIVTVYVT